jgi:predicted nucleic-acid-binding Zn-ribbon protein
LDGYVLSHSGESLLPSPEGYQEALKPKSLLYDARCAARTSHEEELMKRSGVCPKCDSRKIGYLENVIHRTEGVMDSVPIRGHALAPFGVERTQSGGLIKVIKEGPSGQLEAYVCGSCGYYETYLKDPDSVNYEAVVGFRWLSAS